jgi:hypothetical protein
MSSTAVLPGSNRRSFVRSAAPATAALFIIAFAVFGGSASAEAVTSTASTAANASDASTALETPANATPVVLDSPDLTHVAAGTRSPVETIATSRREGAVPCALIAILVLCGGVFVRVFVSIRHNSGRARFAFTGGSDSSTEHSRELELSGIPILALAAAASPHPEPVEA